MARTSLIVLLTACLLAGTATAAKPPQWDLAPATDLQQVLPVTAATPKLIVFESFENIPFPPSGWSLVGSYAIWSRYATSAYGTGTGSAKANFYSNSAGRTHDLVSYACTPTAAGDSLLFDHAYATYAGEVDSLTIWTSVDGGSNWVKLIGLRGGAGGPLNTGGTTTSVFVPTSGQWATKRYALPAGTNRLRFRGHSAYGNNLYVDNIQVKYPRLDQDARVYAIRQPGTFRNAPIAPLVTVQNYGTTRAAFPVTFQISCTTAVVYSETIAVDSLNAGDTVRVTFPEWTPEAGQVYDHAAFTALAGDQIPGNDTMFTMTYAYVTPRKAMTELFTATSCPPCVAANDSLNHIWADLGDTMVLVRWHVWWPTNNDPFYLNQGADTANIRNRVSYYSVGAVPNIVINGLYSPGNGQFRSTILNERLTTYAPLTIDLAGTYDTTANSGRIVATLQATGRIIDGDLRLRYLIVQDSISYTGTNGDPVHHQVFRRVMPSINGRTISIGMGETVVDSVDFTVPTAGFTPAINEKQCQVLVYLQSNTARNIWQCQRVPLMSLVPSGVAGGPAAAPAPRTVLLPVGPNPSAGTLRLAYDLAAAGQVRLGVYDVAGRLVAKVVDGTMPAGSHAASWNGADRGGRQVASGVYFVRLEAAGASQTRRITVVR